ncbi:DUF2147 domain-containing protein [Algirhabdus cladophorae]|uniref:DUF2147 domain-containing protein n=1 Tax=Algirhabdus cladophorae TaxID=3377108 RepID=UPI003B847045
MKRTMMLAAGLIFAAGAALADPVLGTWKTEVDDGAYAHIKMSTCGSSICGVIHKAFDASGPIASENVGKKLVWDMNAKGSGSYNGGKIWQPSTGKIYKSKMSLSGNSLKVSGCVGPICKKQTWSRVN